MKKLILAAFFVIVFVVTSKNLFSQEISSNEEVNIQAGFLIFKTPIARNNSFGTYIAPTYRFKKHEFYAGPLVMSTYGIIRRDFPMYGIVAGYRFYFFKEPMRINMFFNYNFLFAKYRNNWYYQGNKYKELENYYFHMWGIGFNVYIDKKRRFSFFSTFSFGMGISKYHSNSHLISDYRIYQYENKFGFCFKLKSFNKKKE